MCFREGDEWPQYLIPRSVTQCASSLLLPSSHSFPWLQATSYMTCSWRLGKSPVHVSQREIFEFSPFALRSEEGDEDHKSYLPHESELSCPCSTLLLSSLGQAAGVQPQSMGIYERLVPGLATINIWQVSVCFYTFLFLFLYVQVEWPGVQPTAGLPWSCFKCSLLLWTTNLLLLDGKSLAFYVWNNWSKTDINLIPKWFCKSLMKDWSTFGVTLWVHLQSFPGLSLPLLPPSGYASIDCHLVFKFVYFSWDRVEIFLWVRRGVVRWPFSCVSYYPPHWTILMPVFSDCGASLQM